LPKPAAPRSSKTLFTQLPRALRLVFEADRRGAVGVIVLTLLQAGMPAAVAWVGKLIIDQVARASKQPSDEELAATFQLVALEAGLALGTLLLSRLSAYAQGVLRANLGNVINRRILEKSLALELSHFEDSTTYDRMQNARREANSRPLSLALSALSLLKNAVTLASFAVLLWKVAWWAGLVLLVAAIPAFLAETKLSGEAFRLFSWRAPEGRRLNYLEWILTRDSHVKEVKLYNLGPLILGRYQELFQRFFKEDKALVFRRLWMGLLFGSLSLLAFYGCYVFVAGRAARAEISLGDLALYLAVFRQGQSAFEAIFSGVGGMYEDALFLSNLFLFLELPTLSEQPRTLPLRTLPAGNHSLELRGVSFRYPGKEAWALKDLNLTLAAGEKLGLVGANGAGKSTLIKLLLRLYEPTEGAILYGGVDVRQLEVADLRARFGAVFQDFVRYQFTVQENIGLGDVAKLDDFATIERAAKAGGADEVVAELPEKYQQVLGGWFEKGTELSSGQWQKLAVARAFMREAEVLILDEPTASIDAEAEFALFERFRALAKDRTAIVISHRFSTVRLADRIAVLEGGRLVELGSHEALVAQDGRYAHLFKLQARGYLA
jgi:ATP-binding cassette subfamily B protein